MSVSTWSRRLIALLALTARLALPAAADPPGAPWVTADIGKPPVAGKVDVDASGVWSITGSGVMRWGYTAEFGITRQDQFHCAYQRLKGDASITARFVGASFPGGWVSNNALMIRENDTPGSPNVYYLNDPSGIGAQARFAQGRQNRLIGFLGTQRSRGVTMRLQRVDNEITGFYSLDGRVWSPDFDPILLPTLPEEALFGLLVNADRNTLTARWDQVQARTGAELVPGLKLSARDGKVLLEWRRLKDAVGYNVYRGPFGATPDQLLRVNADQVAQTSFADSGLVNGTRVTYAVAALFRGADGALTQGPLVTAPVTPPAVPGEWTGAMLNASPLPGAAAYDAATDTFAIEGPGWGDSDTGESGYFLHQRIEGDVQITARLLDRPTGTLTRQAGVMLRESLDAGARQMRIGFAPSFNNYSSDGRGGLYTDRRRGPDTVRQYRRLLRADAVALPVLLRLTRRGDTITSEYSLDDGKTYVLGQTYAFTTPLEKALYVGMYIHAGHDSSNRNAISKTRFSGVVVGKP